MTTPEGRIKRRLEAKLNQLHIDVWSYAPQAGPFGRSGVPDRLVLVRGHLVAIECKANATKKPTRVQIATMNRMRLAGATVFLVYDDDTIDVAVEYIRKRAGVGGGEDSC
jgi:hypothetical protein